MASAAKVDALIPFAVQSRREKYFAFGVGQIIFTSSPHPGPKEGRHAIVTAAGRDAVDVDGACDESA